jgi:ubiquinone/menaquinone biosynthesis C-methylase UbiE
MNDSVFNKRVAKFESHARLAELDPKHTLTKIGFEDGMTLCDIGAGTGVFTFAAADISRNNIYALDISDDMINLLTSRIEERAIDNIHVAKVTSDELPVENNACNIAIMVTVLHEIDNKKQMLSEIKRILKPAGKLMIIEFHKIETPIGPPVDRRLSEQEVEEICSGEAFRLINSFSLGNNLYAKVFEC